MSPSPCKFKHALVLAAASAVLRPRRRARPAAHRACRRRSRPAPSCAPTPSGSPATTRWSRRRCAARPRRRSARRAPPPTAAEANAARPRPIAAEAASSLDEFWELTPERKRGTFNFTGYRPELLLPGPLTSRVNRNPGTPSPGHAGTLPAYHHTEAKLQISVRTKLAEGLLLPNADLWFAYTQQSLWQIYSGSISRPFRATDHEPELIYIVPTPFELPFGLRRRWPAWAWRTSRTARRCRSRAAGTGSTAWPGRERRCRPDGALQPAHPRARRPGRQPRLHPLPGPHRAARPLEPRLLHAERAGARRTSTAAARSSSTSRCRCGARTRRACAGTPSFSAATARR